MPKIDQIKIPIDLSLPEALLSVAGLSNVLNRYKSNRDNVTLVQQIHRIKICQHAAISIREQVKRFYDNIADEDIDERDEIDWHCKKIMDFVENNFFFNVFDYLNDDDISDLEDFSVLELLEIQLSYDFLEVAIPEILPENYDDPFIQKNEENLRSIINNLVLQTQLSPHSKAELIYKLQKIFPKHLLSLSMVPYSRHNDEL